MATRLQEAKAGDPAHVPHVVSCCIEHPAVLECLVALAAQGLLTYTLVPVSEEGIVRLEQVEAAIKPETCLLSFMHR
jgi:cysteine desulfurase